MYNNNNPRIGHPILVTIASATLFLLLARESHTYPSGAPPSQCRSMIPSHNAEPQKSVSPYSITLDKTTVQGGQPIRVTLTSPSGAMEFAGFLALGQKHSSLYGETENAFGTVKYSGDSLAAKPLSCHDIPNSGMTHGGNARKTKVEFDWIAPNEDGEYVILATFVQNAATFWVRQPSAKILVKRDAQFQEVEKEKEKEKAEEQLSAEVKKRLSEFYQGCGKTKGCFGLPSKCVSTESCEMLTTFEKKGENHVFQLGGKLLEGTGYVATGLSFDDKMPQSSIIACVLENGVDITVSSYYALNYSRPQRSQDPNDGFTVLARGIENGEIFCEFTRTPKLTVVDETEFDLNNDEYHISLAKANSGTPDALARHTLRGAGSDKVKLDDTIVVGETEEEVIKGRFYNGCGERKGCFGVPAGCLASRNCEMFTSFDENLNFQVTGRIPSEGATQGHVSVGLSFDQQMGQDSVTGCVLENGSVRPRSYYNVPGLKNNAIMQNPNDGIFNEAAPVGTIFNGYVYCEFTRTPLLNSPDELKINFDLKTDKYYILMARGSTVEAGRLGFHTSPGDKVLTGISVFLNETTTFGDDEVRTTTEVATENPDRSTVDPSPGNQLREKFYGGCGQTKGCFGVPRGCLTTRTCEMFTSFDRNLNFQVTGRIPSEGATQGHVSVGLSFDNIMGQDSVIGCVLDANSVRPRSYYNLPGENTKDNAIMQKPDDGIASQPAPTGTIFDGHVFCEFTRTPLLSSPTEIQKDFNLITDNYYILMARASTVEAGRLSYHADFINDKAITDISTFLNETTTFGDDIIPVTDEPFSDDVDLLRESFYGGCGKTKGCFGLPDKCVQNRNCEMFTSFNKDLQFQITGKSDGHISVGLSFDDKMGQDSVIGCIFQNDQAQIGSYYNHVSGKGNSGFAQNSVGIKPAGRKSAHIDGYVFCEFTRTEILNTTELQRVFNLKDDKYFFLLSRAPFASLSQLGQHPGINDKGAAPEAVALSWIGILGVKSNILIELHASFMILAWLMCASTGMFTARYYKQTHTDFNPLNKAFWFVLHMTCMFTTVFLTICGGIFIFIEVNGYSEGLTGPARFHPILGITLSGLALCQVFIAFFRPHPGTARRPIFNWIHWTIGNTAHIVGIACIFLAEQLSKGGVTGNKPYLFVLVGFVIFHVAMHVVMSIHTVWADKQMDTQVRMRAVRPGPMKPSGKSDEAPGTGFRTAMLTLYLIGAAATAITLIAIVTSKL